MVFSSAPPANLDPSIWQPQRPDHHGGEPENAQVPTLLQPPPPVIVGGGSAGKPSLMSDLARLGKLPIPDVALKCPRCESTNTKFCYFNNYNLSQPRHFCKTCRRYWTRGGALRNVPVGGGCRRNNKRSKGGNSSKSLATNSPSFGPSRCTTDNIMNSLAINPQPKLPFLPSFHHLTDHYGAGPAVGLTFGNVQTAVPTAGNDIDMINIGNNSQWRMQQMQPQFPFVVSEGLTAGMYQLESEGAATADYFGCKNVDSEVSQVDGGINMEEINLEGVNMSKRFMGISGSDNHLWGISNPWSNASSSTNHVL